jgi:uncharacterized membrane protein
MKALFQRGSWGRIPFLSAWEFLALRLPKMSAWGGGALVVLLLAFLAHAGFCAFTWRKFAMFDYGVYTNMIWNSGHGHLFCCLLDRSYLATHLSFTLALLGPLYLIWDHPFLLWTVQWCFLAGGAALLARTAVRLRVPYPVAAAIAVFLVGYHFTQRVQLSEFHGVSLYLLLVPWLYHCLRCNRRWVWAPWLLTLGMREEAAVVILPLLVYFAVRERWRAGFVYAALSVGYMVLAMTELFPLFTGMSLVDRRSGDLAGGGPLAHFLNPETLEVRLQALFWVVLPALPFAWKKGWIPLLLFPSLALIQTMGGGKADQYTLSLHYSAPIMACLAVAMVEAVSRGVNAREENGAVGWLKPWLLAASLLLITAASYRVWGFLPGSRQRHVAEMGCYVKWSGAGLRSLQAARYIPREGVLVCPTHMAGFCSNRKDITDWRHFDPAHQRMDLIFTEAKYLDDRKVGFRRWLEGGQFGLIYFDGSNVILKRGADPAPNHLVMEAYDRARAGTQFPRSLLPKTKELAMVEMPIPALHWAGAPRGESLEIIASSPNTLEAGDYEAVFLFSALAPEEGGMDAWGELQVRRAGQTAPLAEAEIEPIGCGPRVLRTQRVAFTLEASSRVEAWVVGRRAELWLLRVDYVRRGESWDF